MGTKSQKQTAEPKAIAANFVKDIRRKTRKLYSSEQKILIVMEALRGEEPVAAICRKHGIAESMFYKWNKEFLEAGKKRLTGDTTREATSDEVTELRKENQKLKEIVADLMLRYDIVKKSLDYLG
jgi:transposase